MMLHGTCIVTLFVTCLCPAFADSTTLIDFGRTAPSDWVLESDGYSVPAREKTAGLKIVKSDGYRIPSEIYAGRVTIVEDNPKGSVLGIRFAIPLGEQPSYWLLRPAKTGDAVHEARITAVSLFVSGRNDDTDVAVLAEDKDGRKLEIYIGTLNYEGWQALTFVFPQESPVYGFRFKGITFYKRGQASNIIPDRVVYIKKLVIVYEPIRLEE
jgi:hypothetical protein